MDSLSSPPAAVKGNEILVIGQDIKPAGLPKKLKGTNEVVYPLNVKIRGESIIIKENRPKTTKFKAYSMLDIGSKISGKWLWGFSSNFISRGDIAIGGKGRTGSHPGQELKIEGTCFAEIISGWRGSPLQVHPSNELLISDKI